MFILLRLRLNIRWCKAPTHTLSCRWRKLISTIKTANEHKYYFGFNMYTKQKRDFVTIKLRISNTFCLFLSSYICMLMNLFDLFAIKLLLRTFNGIIIIWSLECESEKKSTCFSRKNLIDFFSYQIHIRDDYQNFFSSLSERIFGSIKINKSLENILPQ